MDPVRLVGLTAKIVSSPKRFNNQADPVPPLDKTEAAWTDELPKSKGLRQ
jgi:hypothetical protein